MENIKVSIESPVKYYDFMDQHGEVLATLRFVPSDIDIFERYHKAYGVFKNMYKELEALNRDQLTDDESTEIKNKYASELKGHFDNLFKADTSGLFDVASPFTPLESGEAWALVILKTVQKIVEEVTGKNFKAMQSKASKYTEKYHAGPGKYPFPVK